MVERICETCKRTFYVYPSRLKDGARFCNMRCYNKTGSANPKWKNGEFVNKGYRYRYAPEHPHATRDGYVLEHRLVMESSIGRLLKKTEAVHHVNGNTLNNSIENLQLCESNGKHVLEHHVTGRNARGQFRY